MSAAKEPPRVQNYAVGVLIEAAIFIGIGPLVGAWAYLVIHSVLTWQFGLFSWDLLPIYAGLLAVVYMTTWKAAAVTGVVVAFARVLGVRRAVVMLIFAAAVGYLVSNASWPQGYPSPLWLGYMLFTELGVRVGLAGAVASAVCASIVGKLWQFERVGARRVMP
ncbi:MAG: hypothetical protein WD626_03875 [Bauldia sp.]